jgi:CspA family cold shock protein
MAVGTLTWWNADRGFGFIQPDAGGPDMFLHLSALEEAGIDPIVLRIGQRMSYETGDHNGKSKAVDIKMISPHLGAGLKAKGK